MFKVGDLVVYAPFSVGMSSWVMYGGIGIVISLKGFDKRGKMTYKVKWVDTFEEVFIPEDFLTNLLEGI